MRPRSIGSMLLLAVAVSALASSSALAQTGGTGTGTGTGTTGTGSTSGQGLTRDAFSDDNSTDVFSTDTGPGAGSTTGQTNNRAGNNGGAGAFGGMGGGANIFSQLFGGQSATNSSARRVLRAPMRVQFDVVRPPAPQIANVLSNRLANIGSLKGLSTPIQVEIVDRVATLRGEVNSEQQKDLAERMTRLEPGVSSVVNQLVVTPQ